jgi:hypothetical protein
VVLLVSVPVPVLQKACLDLPQAQSEPSARSLVWHRRWGSAERPQRPLPSWVVAEKVERVMLEDSTQYAPRDVDEVPQPVLQEVHNGTPFKHMQFDKMGPGRRFYDVVVLSASYDLQAGEMPLSKTQRGPVMADEFWDEENAPLSSLKAAGDILLVKPGSDVIITGTAFSFENVPRTDWFCGLRVRRDAELLLSKTLRLTGPRVWLPPLFGSDWRLRKPVPAAKVPMRYEQAYGGHWTDAGEQDPILALHVYEANPSGTGHFSPSRPDKDICYGPQIELVSDPITNSRRRYTPAGLGPVARFWQPRAARQGTYDDVWLKQFHESAIPDYPPDFDTRYFQCAPDDQIIPGFLWGNEHIELFGLFAETETMTARLPGLWVHAWGLTSDFQVVHDYMKLDTVHIDLDSRQVHLTWRLTLDHDKAIQTVMLESKPLHQRDVESSVAPIRLVRNIREQ